MSLQLCASCRHAYPPSVLRKSSFTENIGDRLGAITSGLAQLKGGSPEEVHQIQQLRIEVQSLCSSIHEEFEELNKKINNQEEQASRKEKYAEAKGGSEDDKYFMASRTSATMMNSSSGEPSGAYRPTFNNSVQSYNMKKMTLAFDLVSASIYRLLESLAVQTRADTALVWLRPSGFVAVELIAPFVVGRDMSKLLRSAPYRVPESSIPCAVGSTGIAVNIKPREKCRDPRSTDEIPLLELIEKSNAAQLVAPVFSKGGELDRTVLAVVHLIGSPRFPFPFNKRNEDTTVQAASLLTTLISSHYEVMIGDWTNRFYDPSVLQTTSSYRADLDMRSDEKGMDDFSVPPTLIYRCTNDRVGEFDPREASKALRQCMTKSAAPLAPLAGVKDLHRHATTMENNWSSAVQYTSRLEGMIGTLKEEQLMTEVGEIRQQRDKLDSTNAKREQERIRHQNAIHQDLKEEEPVPPVPPIPLEEKEEAFIPEEVQLSARTNTSRTTIQADQVDELEFLALQRLKDLGVDTSAFT
ncbi:hypothetical protein AGDE_02861 [Angomonas deanei]|nr:hypothetical protein AGDE_02861 [Angomonas deanei]|eukprot:EPY41064.1 hypothetical protein AGDE_02861 [Angomonas deanei]